MFTGIVRAIGRIDSLERRGSADLRVRIHAPDLAWSGQPGDSIAVNGVCLTVAERLPDGFGADVSGETLAVTTLGELQPQDRVNLEPALAAGDPLGGHLVAGHVDCVGRVTRVERAGQSTRMVIDLPPEYRRYLARKGSICVDGVSLTINEVSGHSFEVNIIPHTAGHTIAGGYVAGTRVNVEVDLVARYLESLLGGTGASAATQELSKAQRHA
jgi:riboflavin synthase